MIIKDICAEKISTKITLRSSGHRPVIVKRALIGSKGGWKLSTIFKLKSAPRLVNNKITGKNHIYFTNIYLLHLLKHLSAFDD